LNKNLARRLRQVAIGVERLIRGALETTGDDDDAGPEPDWDKALHTGRYASWCKAGRNVETNRKGGRLGNHTTGPDPTTPNKFGKAEATVFS
jgi:hypothetical protein